MAIQTIPGSAITAGTITATQMSNTIQMGGPKISSIILTDSGYATITDTALGLSGGYIRILGTGFVTGCSVSINTVIATSVTFISSTEVRAQLPSMSAGTYIMYLSNSDGGVAIRVNALTYSSTPSWTSTSPLTGGVVNTAISIQLGATSDSTISYTVQAGSTLPTGLTLSSGGLLAGTVTGIALETTYNFTVVATDLESQISPKAFSITIVVADQYFKSTVLLLNADVTPFTADASTNKFEISPVGTPSANVNNPVQPGYYSIYLPTFSAYYYYSDTVSGNFSTGDFTVEGWFYLTSSNQNLIMSSPTTNSWSLITYADQLYWQQAGGNLGGAGYGTVPKNQWVHLAASRTGGSINLYINGTRVYTVANTYSYTGTPTRYIGANSGGDNAPFYISNLRIIKGTGIYSGTTITVPTSPLTAITGTSLLTCQSYTMKDNSTNAVTFTTGGTPSISVTQPFTLPSPYTGYGSGLFNGTGDYLQSPSNAALTLGTSDFTIEAWVYLTVAGSASVLGPVWDGRPSVNGAYPYLLVQGNTTNYNVAWYVNATNQVTAPTLALNTWHHIAYSRSYATAGRLFVNGALIQSWVDNVNYLGSQGRIGSNYDASGLLGGYISNLRITKGTAVYTGAFTPPTLAALTNAGATSAAAYQSTTNVNITFASSATSLLTLQNNQAQNNNQFRDSSTNNFAVTRTGTPTQGTFTPFSQTGWSGYFNGTTDCIQVPAGVAFAPGTGDFTVEGWFFATNTMISNYPTTLPGMLFNQAISGTNYFTIQAGDGNNGKIYFTATSSGGGTVIASGSNSWTVGSWNHFAVVRISGMVTVYLNGIGGTATSNTIDLSNTSYVPTIGRYTHTAQCYFFGYISNLRYVKGIGVYTGAFTPPTTALQATQSSGTNITAITGTATSLLTLQSNRFKDNSTNNFAITASGTPSIQAFSPFAPSAAYSTSAVGGSVYFPGSSNLLVPSNASLALGTGDFTIEMWAYNSSTTNRLISYATVNSPIIYLSTSNYVQYDNYGAASLLTSSILTPLNTWNHIAIVRLSGTTKMYINGVQAASGADATSYGQNGIYIGTDVATTFMTGYLSNVRIVKGTAVYTGAFIPSTTPLTAIANTVLLLNATNSGIFDATGKNDLVTVGDARVSTSKQKYGSGAMYFDGTGDYLSMLAAPNLYFGAGDFTIEAWIWKSANGSGSGGYDGIFQLGVSGSVTDGCVLEASSARGYYFTMGGGWSLQYNVSPNDSTWHHVAVSRSGNNTRLFVDGVQQAIYTSAYTIPSTATYALVGAEAGTSYPFNGYIDDLRVTKGVARYTANFTPPTTAMLGQ